MPLPWKCGPVLSSILLAAYCWYWIGGGIHEGFTHDDLMNTQRAAFTAWRELWAGCVMLWRPDVLVRPVGEMAYKALWSAFGFSPAPYHAVCLSLAVLNSVLAFWVIRGILKSTVYALLGAWCLAYHGSFWGMYSNTGVIFDILTGTFYFAGMGLMLWRPEGRERRALRLVLVAVCTIAALNSKESAVTLPLAMAVAALMPGADRSIAWRDEQGLWRWDLGCVAVSVSLTAVFALGRVMGHGGLQDSPRYALELTADRIGRNAAEYLWNLCYGKVTWTPASAGALYGGVAVALGLLRWRVAGLAWLMAGVAYLPLAFIPPRGLDASYLSVFWLAAAIAAAVQQAVGQRRYGWAAAVALMGAVTAVHGAMGRIPFPVMIEESRQIARVYRELKPVVKMIPNNALVAIVKDEMGEKTEWATTFMTLLILGRSDLTIDRVKDLEGDRWTQRGQRPYDVAFSVTWRRGVELCRGMKGGQLTAEDVVKERYSCSGPEAQVSGLTE